MKTYPIRDRELHRGLSSPKELGPSLEENVWVDCKFTDCRLSGAMIAGSVFSGCLFEDLELYWCHAYRTVFICCTFKNCDLRGSFDKAKFVRCVFQNCEVGDNALGGKTEWEGAVEFLCEVTGAPLPIVDGEVY